MIILEPWKIRITDKFVKHAHEASREMRISRSNADALLYEWLLITSRIVERPENWRHDFIYEGMKIDVKELYGKYFNIQTGKYDQYKKSIVAGELTHLLFYTTTRPRDRLLKEGDLVDIIPLGLCSARDLMRSIVSSKFEDTDYYIHLNTIILNGINNDQD